MRIACEERQHHNLKENRKATNKDETFSYSLSLVPKQARFPSPYFLGPQPGADDAHRGERYGLQGWIPQSPRGTVSDYIEISNHKA
jgi:hypothetical protein